MQKCKEKKIQPFLRITSIFGAPVAALFLLVVTLSACNTTTKQGQSKSLVYQTPDISFFERCAFVCVDIQPSGRHKFTEETLPKAWLRSGATAEDANEAVNYTIDTAHPNAARVANACRKLGLPMVFVFWGTLFDDCMDIDPKLRRELIRNGGADVNFREAWGHHIDKPHSRPADCLNVQDDEYVIPKTAQDAFTSSNIGFVLENLQVDSIVFVGGHNGACLGKTANSAINLGYKTLVIEDATFDAVESQRIPRLMRVGYDFIMKTQEFESLANHIVDSEFAHEN